MESVTYYSGSDKVHAWLYLPGNAPPCPAVVFAPGFTGTKFAAFYRPYVDRMLEAGVAVLLIDYRGWGESEGPRGHIRPLWQVEDLRNALSYLEVRPEIDADRLGIFGVSFGGGNATYVTSVDARVRCGIAISAVGDGEDWLRSMRRSYEWREFLDLLNDNRRQTTQTGVGRIVDPTNGIMIETPERRETAVKGDVPTEMVPRETPLDCANEIIDYRPKDVLHRKGDRAMMWICVADDVVVPPRQTHEMYAIASEPKRLLVLPGRAHYGAYVEHCEAIMDASIAWFAEHL